jgi:enoyl-CoA hydratase/carnithine racemase
MELETLLYEQEDGVAVITMNRPEVHNAFNHRMQAELHGLWRHLRRNEDVRAVVLTGAGDEAFCVGIDRGETIEESYLAYEENRWKMQGKTGPVSTPFMFNDPGVNINPKTNDLWKPIIAAVNGMACGGALYMLGESDIIIAADHATFFDPHVTYGMVAGFESTHLLQKLPLGEVLRIMLLGAWERMSAERAHQMGLVSEIVPGAELRERALWVAKAIASAPVMAVQGTLRAIWMTHELSRREALAQVSTFVALGTLFDDVAGGQEIFEGNEPRPEWRLR